MLRRFALVAFAIAWPPALAIVFFLGTRYGLAAMHRHMDPTLLREGFLIELALFYLAALVELRSRWSGASG